MNIRYTQIFSDIFICLRRRLSSLVIQSIDITCIRPKLEYASVAWCGVGVSDAERLERVQRAAGRLIARVSITDRLPRHLLLARAGLESLQQRRRLHCWVFAYQLTSTSRRFVPLHLALLFERWQSRVLSSTSVLVLRSASSGHSRLPRP